jgi:hypothetical protein
MPRPRRRAWQSPTRSRKSDKECAKAHGQARFGAFRRKCAENGCLMRLRHPTSNGLGRSAGLTALLGRKSPWQNHTFQPVRLFVGRLRGRVSSEMRARSPSLRVRSTTGLMWHSIRRRVKEISSTTPSPAARTFARSADSDLGRPFSVPPRPMAQQRGWSGGR